MRTVILEIAAPGKKKADGFTIRLLVDQPEAPGSCKPIKSARATLASTFELPVAIEYPRGTVLKIADINRLYATSANPSDAFMAIGNFLFNLIAPGAVGREWSKLRQSLPPAADGTPAMRTILSIANHEQLKPLRELPWELLYDNGNALQVALEHSVLHKLDEHWPPGGDDWPLRVLVVHAVQDPAKGGGNASIGAGEELDAIEALFAKERHLIEYELLEHPLPEDIENACRAIRPHVLHFIGHAREGAQDAQLLLHRPAVDGRPFENTPWSMRDIRTQLNGIAPQLVFLNACRTTNAAAGTPLGIASIADAFILAGSSAVLGMQADVPGDLARIFSETFYQQLIAGQTVDIAAFTARRAMSRKRPGLATRSEWSFPVLRTVVPPETILPEQCHVNTQSWKVLRIVDRVRQRRVVREATAEKFASVQGQASSSLIVMQGDRGSGKTHLARWCGQLSESHGLRHLYIDFGKDRSGIDVLDTLRWIRDGKRPVRGEPTVCVPGWPLLPEAFRAFNWFLRHRMQGVTVTPDLPQGNEPIEDGGLRLIDVTALPETFIPDTLQSFSLALKQAAKSQPLLITLDHLEQLDTPSLDHWLPFHLFKAVADRTISNVRMLLVASRADYESRMKPLAELQPTVVDVDHFESRDFEWLARHLCRQWSEDTLSTLRSSFATLLKNERGKGKTLAQCLQTLDRMCSAYQGDNP